MSESSKRRRSPSPDDRDRDRSERKDKRKKKHKKEKSAKEPKLYQMVGYTNEENPFGDHNLNQQFVWKKKAEKDGVDLSKMSKRDKVDRQNYFLDEIQKVRRRRSDREAEQEEMERLKAEESRLREAEMYADWHQKEEEFHLEQARVRSKIRLVEGREKPIDIIAKNIILLGDDGGAATGPKDSTADTSRLEVELREPHTVFEGLVLPELRELLGDIKTYQELEAEGPHSIFWRSLRVVCAHEIEVAARGEGGGSSSSSAARRQDSGIHSSVKDEITASFAGKTSAELEDTRAEMQGKIDSNDGTIDVEFWEGVLQELQVYRAKADLREFHQKMLKNQLQRLEERREQLRRYREEHPEEAAAAEAEEARQAAEAADDSFAAAANLDSSAEANAMLRAEAGKGMEDLEEELGLNDEVRLRDQVYWWQDKYRPRKPRYFNRVKTGYEWNKYNQTHYDHDNPPPKTVQGYKFSIFYPDLIDRSKTPRYILEPADTKDFCILRFSAGPPYEDIAFKIVNREWEFGRKRGFKCVFERGILQLFFNFKRHRYRK